MSTTTKRRMSHAAAIATRDDKERATKKLLDCTNCPLILVYSRSGGPSTENSFVCQFDSGVPGDPQHCPSYGKIGGNIGCRLLPLLYKRRDVDRFLALRKFQTNTDLYTKEVDGQMGWWSGPGINERFPSEREERA